MLHYARSFLTFTFLQNTKITNLNVKLRLCDRPLCSSRIYHRMNNVGRTRNYSHITTLNCISPPKKNICSDLNVQKRSLSMQGFVEWQQNFYMSISSSAPVETCQNLLLQFHDGTGLPWWASIVLSTIIVRSAVTLPLSIYQNYILAKVENVTLEMKDIAKELAKETAIAKKMYELNDVQTNVLFKKSLKKQWTNLITRDNCHPFKASLLIWFQIPMWVSISFGLRNLVYMQPRQDPAAMVTYMELTGGGFGWIPNLTEADHSWVLPIAFGLINLAIIELQSVSKLRQPSRIQNIFTNIFRGFSILMIPVAANVPSCMCVYWLTSSTYGLLQNIILLSPKIRRTVRIPQAPSELKLPYHHVRTELAAKVQKFIPVFNK